MTKLEPHKTSITLPDFKGPASTVDVAPSYRVAYYTTLPIEHMLFLNASAKNKVI